MQDMIKEINKTRREVSWMIKENKTIRKYPDPSCGRMWKASPMKNAEANCPSDRQDAARSLR
jgi:hypothetical protein